MVSYPLAPLPISSAIYSISCVSWLLYGLSGLIFRSIWYIGVRGFPLRPIPSLGAMGPGPGHLGKFFSARRRRRRRRRRRPWRDQPTTNLPTYLPTYMPKMKHTWYWLRVSTWIILRKKIWAQYYRQIDRNSDIYLVSMVLSHFEKSHFLKKVSPDRLAHIRHVSFCKILHCLPLGM